MAQQMSISSQSEFFSEAKKHPDRFYIVHYSCQNLNDGNEGLSPRVTSIAVVFFANDQTVSFSTHSIAEEIGITCADVATRYDEVEKRLLESFYTFVRDRRDKYWVHWNTRNIAYGFEHIEHRFRTLTRTEAPVIPVEQRINLNDMLADRYGTGYANHPKMPDLVSLNAGLPRLFLTGAEEVQAFARGEFIRMHQSTLSKVGFFRQVMQKVFEGRLKTSRWGFLNFVDKLFDSRTARAVGLATSLLTLVGFAYGVVSYGVALLPSALAR